MAISKTNIILYPRAYNKRGPSNLHSVKGLDQNGQEVNVKLRLDDSASDLDYAPSISEFSRDDRKAKQPCIATDSNRPGGSEGILLFTRCYPDDTDDQGASFVAKWGYVLAADSDAPKPIFAIGRMSVNKMPPTLFEVKRQIKEAEKSGDAKAIKTLNEKLLDPKNYSYPIIFYWPERLSRWESKDSEEIRDFVAEQSRKAAVMGVVGGVMLRLIRHDGKVVFNSVTEVFSRYLSMEKRFEEPEEFADHVCSKIDDVIVKDASANLEILPTARLPSGYVSNQYYGDSKRYEALTELYFKNDEPQVCDLAVKVGRIGVSDDLILNKAYSLGVPLGHPARLDSKGMPSLTFDVDSADLSLGGNRSEEITIGLTSDRVFDRNWSLLGSEVALAQDSKLSNAETDEQKDEQEATDDDPGPEVINDTVQTDSQTNEDRVEVAAVSDTPSPIGTDIDGVTAELPDETGVGEVESADVMSSEDPVDGGEDSQAKPAAPQLQGMAAFLAKKGLNK